MKTRARSTLTYPLGLLVGFAQFDVGGQQQTEQHDPDDETNEESDRADDHTEQPEHQHCNDHPADKRRQQRLW